MGNKEDVDGNCYSFEALPLDTCEGEVEEMQAEATTPECESRGCHFFNGKFVKDFFSSWYRPRWLPGILSRNKRGNSACEVRGGNNYCLHQNEEGHLVQKRGEVSRCSSSSCISVDLSHQGKVDGYSQVDEDVGKANRIKAPPRACGHRYRQVTAVISSSGTETQVDYTTMQDGPLTHLTRTSKGGGGTRGSAVPGRPVCILNDRGCMLNKSTQTKHVTWQCSECVSEFIYKSG